MIFVVLENFLSISNNLTINKKSDYKFILFLLNYLIEKINNNPVLNEIKILKEKTNKER